MKKRILSLLLSTAAIAFICNCGDSPVEQNESNQQQQAYVVSEPSFAYTDGDNTYIISQTTGVVSDIQGNLIGYADLNAGIIVAPNGAPLVTGMDITALVAVAPPVVTSAAWILVADQIYVIYPIGTVTDEHGNPVGTIIDPATGLPGVDFTTTSIINIVALDGTPMFESVNVNELRVMSATVQPTPVPVSSASIILSSSATQPLSSAVQPILSSSSQQKPVSSSSARSSSSVQSSSSAKSSSSSSIASSSSQAVTPNFKIKSGGRSGQGWGSRYWDCCKPHCAWTGKGGLVSRTCDANQNTLEKGNDFESSICEGGKAGLCNDQAPFAVNDELAYAFAAGPGNSYSSSCGTCLLLTFTGESRHTTDDRTKALKGKKMVIMISNIGYDVEEGQFDLMIPGGGVGIFNGCSALWGINNLGAQHGGFLKDCGGDKKLSGSNVATVQKCLEDKCNSVFANIPEAKKGCLFHAQWLAAANNPSFKYEELSECPKELLDKF